MQPFSLRWLILFTLVVLILPSCGDTADESADTTTAPTTTTKAAPTTTTEAPITTTAPSTTAVASSTSSTTEMATPTLPPELESKYPVVLTEGVTGPDTQDIAVWAPDADGPWPIVIVFHGFGSQGIHYDATASLIASQGVVVFAPDYRSTLIPTTEWKSAYRDAECAYRHIRTVASEYGGDTDHPITVVGHSIGASVGMTIVLDEATLGPEGPFTACPGDVPRPDRLVAMSGCYYKNLEGGTLPFNPSEFGWAHQDANIQLVVGSEDEVCDSWQSQDAETQLIADGYSSVDLAVIDSADHFSVIFTGYENGPWYGPDVEWFARPNDPGGVAAVQIILDTTNTAPR